MVWKCFSRNAVGSLVRITEIMDRFVYEKILSNHMLPHADGLLVRDWLFQHDNDAKHKSKHVINFLKSKKVEVIAWPSQSPDLNLIEHLWQELDRRVRTKSFSNKQDFFNVLREEWANIPVERLRTLVDSMQARCVAVIKAKGYATKYY